MKRFLLLLVAAIALVLLIGCENKRDKVQSDLNVLADTWDGTDKFPVIEQADPWGNLYSADVAKGPLNFELTVRSNGPDGLPKNRDDFVVRRIKRHGETTINKEVERGASSISRGITRGIKEGLNGTDPESKNKKDEPKKEPNKDEPKKD